MSTKLALFSSQSITGTRHSPMHLETIMEDKVITVYVPFITVRHCQSVSSHYLSVSQCQSTSVTFSQSISVSVSQCQSPSVTVHHYQPLFITFLNHFLSLSVTVCHCQPLLVTGLHLLNCQSSSLTISPCSSLSAIFSVYLSVSVKQHR